MYLAPLMERALDGAWARHEVLANNVANAETPGYRRLDVDFRSALLKSMGSSGVMTVTHPKHLTSSRSQKFVVSQSGSSVTPDGNGVDIDKEMAEVSTNALYYASVSRQLAAYYSMLRKAVTEGRR